MQDLAGVAFGLAPLTADAERRGDDEVAQVLRGATGTLRQGVRDLRTLLVEIHPPNLESAGLKVALSDLLSPLAATGIATSLEVDESAKRGARRARLPRGARGDPRCPRARRAGRGERWSSRACPASDTRLVVSDDGTGFSEDARAQRGAEGHLGLTLLGDVVAQAGGTLAVQSAPGQGTTIDMRLPRR